MTGAALWFWVACAGPGGDDSGQGGDSSDGTETGIDVVDDTGVPPDDTGGTDTDTGEVDTGPDDDLVYAAFFDAAEVQRIDLEISEEGLAALRADPDTYVEGVFLHDGYRLEGVGVKLKGGNSTFEDIDGKPSLKVRLDAFDDDQDYGGLSRVNLHNMKADPSQAREVVASAVWTAAGLPAPLANYAEVYVNGVLYGLYANVEELDESFVERRWADPEGDLWEANNDADLTPGGILNYSSSAGEGDLDALDAARREIQTGDGPFYDVANGVLDMPQFLDFWAWQIVLGNEDGYPYDLDDHSLYANPEDSGRLAYVPWALDETWDDGFDWESVTGTVAVHCAYDDACLVTLKEHVVAALTTYEGLDVNARTQAAIDLTVSAVQADTRRTLPLSDVLAARAALLSDVTARANVVRGQMGL